MEKQRDESTVWKREGIDSINFTLEYRRNILAMAHKPVRDRAKNITLLNFRKARSKAGVSTKGQGVKLNPPPLWK